MTTLEDLRLTLFFTAGLSLTEWDRLGMLERETALYRTLRPHLGGISFVTYGDRRDLEYRSRLEGIDVACNRWRLPDLWYWRWLAAVPARWKTGAVIFKSNQVSGGDTALALARRFHKPFIARCGYLHSDFTIRRFGPDSPQAKRSLQQEGNLFRAADQVVVTTPLMAQVVNGIHGVAIDRIRVIPNYVDVDRFAPAQPGTVHTPGNRVLFIGRLDAQKAPLLLLRALAGLSAELVMVGDGPMRLQVETLAQELGVRVTLMGVQPHAALPDLMRGADLFVLPSDYEGHPKALLEAMACGMAVIGRADAPGVREAIDHDSTGLLCDATPEGMRTAMARILSDPPLKARLGRNARAHAVNHLSLARTVERERELLTELLAEPRRPSPAGKPG
ncbi:MAG: glycosyltransferase family 4 protein [Magnetococcales bacterium]|nr:glycosyltransferase family 4 protein [Magnetococcales bacterium]